MKKTFVLLLAGAILGSTVAFAASKIFSDVPLNAWYSNAVASLSEKGIVAGYTDGTFRPSNNVNRAEVAVMLNNAIEYIQTGKVAGATAFDQCGKLSNYQNYAWFAALNQKYQNEFLKPRGVSPSNDSIGGEFGEGCLSLNGNLFIFIPEYFELGCGKVLSYDIKNNILKTPDQQYCASRFGQRVGEKRHRPTINICINY